MIIHTAVQSTEFLAKLFSHTYMKQMVRVLEVELVSSPNYFGSLYTYVQVIPSFRQKKS